MKKSTQEFKDVAIPCLLGSKDVLALRLAAGKVMLKFKSVNSSAHWSTRVDSVVLNSESIEILIKHLQECLSPGEQAK